MPEPLHHTTLAAIVRLAQAHGLEVVRADDECVTVDDLVALKAAPLCWGVFRVGLRHDTPLGIGATPLHALRAALREAR